LVGSICGIILRYYPGIHVEELRKSTKNLSDDRSSPGRYLNPELLNKKQEY
jgi:hypothetical protein